MAGHGKAAGGAATTPPNVVLIFADDLGYGDLGCYGATKVKTPNIDNLAREGRRFTDAHSASAVCTPSRYALLTGQYPVRANGGAGVWGPAPVNSALIIDPDTLTLADVFKNQGYATAALGKWHLGFGKGTNNWKEPLRPGPMDLGFDYYFGLPVVNSAPPYVYVENDRIVGSDPADPLILLAKGQQKEATPITPIPPEASQRTPNSFKGAVEAHKIYNDYTVGTVLANKATDWITANQEKPFFLYLATTHIHHPFTPGKRFQGTSDAELYGDFIQELDWMVGQVTDCLESHGLDENTLVIFTSDNGAMLNLGGRNAVQAGHHINGDLLGFKFGAWEGGHRVPFIARWPGKIAPGTVSDQLICNVDMLATCTAVTGQDPSALQNKDSMNVLPALLGDPGEPLRDELVLAPKSGRHLSLRKGKWMYIPARGSGGFNGSRPSDHAWGGAPAAAFVGSVNSDIENGRIRKDAPSAQLYDLRQDVNQTTNLYRQHPDVVQEMESLLDAYRPKDAPTKGS
nr:arylsulfatase [Pirellulimonas nuda]